MGGSVGPRLPVPLGLGRKGGCWLGSGVKRKGRSESPCHGCQSQLGCWDPLMEGVGGGPVPTGVECQGAGSMPGEGPEDAAVLFAVASWHRPSVLAELPRCALATAIGFGMLCTSAELCFGVHARGTFHFWAWWPWGTESTSSTGGFSGASWPQDHRMSWLAKGTGGLSACGTVVLEVTAPTGHTG